jgi:hypothetical protein
MRQWYIVHRTGKRLSPVAQAFQSFVLQEAASLWRLPDGRASALAHDAMDDAGR